MKNRIDVNKFRRSNSFYPRISCLATVKSFDLQSIRKRYLESKKRGQKSGSVERRKVGLGGLVSFNLYNGSLQDVNLLTKIKEPRGIDFLNSSTALSSENVVYVQNKNKTYKIENEWFSYIHTTKFNPFDERKILIASSGFDLIFEYDFITQSKTFEWCAWENGLQQTIDPLSGEKVFLTREPAEKELLMKKNCSSILIQNPRRESLPTAMRAAFINSVAYHPNDENKILATLFHKGQVIEIDRRSGQFEIVIDQLSHPHGGAFVKDQYVATSTASGEVFIEDSSEKKIFDFRALAGKPQELSRQSWLQNTLFLSKKLMIVIDSNRTQFHIIDLHSELIDSIRYDENWAVQDIIQTSDQANHQWIKALT